MIPTNRFFYPLLYQSQLSYTVKYMLSEPLVKDEPKITVTEQTTVFLFLV